VAGRNVCERPGWFDRRRSEVCVRPSPGTARSAFCR